MSEFIAIELALCECVHFTKRFKYSSPELWSVNVIYRFPQLTTLTN